MNQFSDILNKYLQLITENKAEIETAIKMLLADSSWDHSSENYNIIYRERLRNENFQIASYEKLIKQMQAVNIKMHKQLQIVYKNITKQKARIIVHQKCIDMTNTLKE